MSLGAAFGQALTEASTDRRAQLGARMWKENDDGTMTEYIYGKAGGTIAANVYCQLTGDEPCEVVAGLTVLNANVRAFGVSMAAMTVGQFGWFARQGKLQNVSLTATAWEHLLANTGSGALTAAGNQTPAPNVVGMVTVDDKAWLHEPGQIGHASDS